MSDDHKSKSSSSSDRLLELDVLRGLAALSVLTFHYTTGFTWRYGGPEHMLFLFPWGQYGVHLFFMISGFVIFRSLEKSSHIFDFIVSRFSKIYPCYWFAVGLTYIVVKKCSLFPDASMGTETRSVLINFSMFQTWFHVANLDTVYWTLAVELLFYFLMAVVFMTKSTEYIELLGAGWLVMMVLNKFFVPVFSFEECFKSNFFYLLKYGNLFYAGILLYNLKSRGHRWYRHAGIALCLLVQYLIWADEKAAVWALIIFLVLFYLFVYGRLTFIIQRPLIFLGTISYSLYLIHQNIGYIIIQWLIVFTRANAWLKFFIPTVVSLGIATLMTYCIEKPVMSFIRRIYKDFKLKMRRGGRVVECGGLENRCPA